MENKKGFTLAEVLITLTIIGIVAALTIPTLINNINEAQYNAGVKNAYTTLSNALSMIQSSNGGIVHVGGVAGGDLANDFCNVMSCNPQTIYYGDIFWPLHGGYAEYNDATAGNADGFMGALYTGYGVNSNVYVLNNGSYLAFNDFGSCDVGTTGVDPVGSSNVCGGIMVDINGNTGPNMFGKDTYYFYIVQNTGSTYSLMPAGSPDDDGSMWDPPPCAPDSIIACTYQRIYHPESMP